MRQLFEAHLVNDPCGDPALYVDLREERRALLFDIGDIRALPPRKLLRLSHVFVSHTHMDHFAGLDGLLRVVLGRKRELALVGGADFVAQVEHKLRAYTWNVVHRYEPELVLDVREVRPAGPGLRARFSSRTGFAREPGAPWPRDGDLLHDEALLQVRGRFVDHEMPCLAFRLQEKPRPRVAKDRLAALGLHTGPWLRDLKLALQAGAPAQTPIRLRWRDRQGDHETTRSVGELAALVIDTTPGLGIGYVTDLRHTPANLQALLPLIAGVDQLYIESAFLDADRAQAQRKNHLTALQAGQIAREAGARRVVPFHFSPRYGRRAAEVVAEVRAAWLGSDAPPAAGEAARPDAADAADAAAAWTRALG